MYDEPVADFAGSCRPTDLPSCYRWPSSSFELSENNRLQLYDVTMYTNGRNPHRRTDFRKDLVVVVRDCEEDQGALARRT